MPDVIPGAPLPPAEEAGRAPPPRRAGRVVWLAVVATLLWQGVAGATSICEQVFRTRSVGYARRFVESTDERLQRVLGADFPLVRALREAAGPGEWVLCRFDPAAALADEQLRAIARLTLLRHALFPTPLLIHAGPQPLAVAEASLGAGRSVLLLVLPDEPSPEGRTGWTCLAREASFQVWRLQKE